MEVEAGVTQGTQKPPRTGKGRIQIILQKEHSFVYTLMNPIKPTLYF
jgi:hypothetical protein